MNKTLRISLIVLAVVIITATLLLTGIAIGRFGWGLATAWTSFSPHFSSTYQDRQNQIPFGYSIGPGMMGGYYPDNHDRAPFDFYSGPGAMGGSGMMGGFGGSGLTASDPLSIEQAQQAVEDYLAALGDPDLAVEEVMIFDNHAYAEIVEASTGIGAMEVLVDPVSLAVYPEHGPNMMWNLKYGMMSGSGGFGMMGGFRPWGDQPQADEISAEMPVSAVEALQSAQDYLDRFLPGSQVDEHADPFYGYYTIHLLRDGKVIGMLSVNGYTSQVFPHTWHGEFIEMSGE